MIRHQKGQVPATQKRLPVKLICYFAFSNKYTAFNFEKYLKSGSGRAFLNKHKFITDILVVRGNKILRCWKRNNSTRHHLGNSTGQT
ncbi:hypothetical protein A3C26_02830 [Candidatus Daviesbacteria bacterium RIFCSPHIGHO2_02_FULL_39_12]|uniref:Uncharacterized protein n=1 Tax=Candidatus Daviesbacteria bacterium RIFCSPHIGHO2_02_FULL_39_12 TaxID=1797770 RepID=A0A1F5JCN5_9BACT|nr:MAG: hypothetical protein A3C26_02830 [Candidatus Daviesbacteria bacterium RIFCSPHIGHO2_02_FULL_39_12]